MRTFLTLFFLILLLPPCIGATENDSEEKNKALIARFYEEVWNKSNYDVADEVYADDYVRNDPRGGTPPAGPRGQKLIAQGFRKSCPNCVMTVERLLADGDFVVGQWRIRGTHQASSQNIDFVGVNIFRFQDGKVAEVWNYRDDLAFSLQTGAVSRVVAPPAQTPKE